jgi:inhibitor of cysteine peptidase
MVRAISCFVISLLLFILTACGGGEPKVLEVSEANAGSRIVLDEGDTLQVSLPGNPGTGYSWELAPEGSTLLERQGEPEFSAESDLLGAPGTIVLRFLAVAQGEETFHLLYHRPWEEDVAPESTFELTVVVE